MRRTVALLVALVLSLALAACGSGSSDEAVDIVQLGTDVLPDEILDLRIEREDVAERIAGTDRSYVESTGLYTLREGKKLQGTIQIARFREEAEVDVEDERFRLSIVNQIGSTEPKAFRMGDDIVYMTAAKRQAVAVFFRPTSFVVLSTLETYDSGRTLLREVLELEL